MRLLTFLILSFIVGTSYAEEIQTYDIPIYINDVEEIIDVDQDEDKLKVCIDNYIKKQSKSYSKIVQHNLYDLMHNLDKITNKIYGKKPPADSISFEEKIEALAKVQCDIYNSMGILK